MEESSTCWTEKYACNKGWQDDDENTIESSKVDQEVRNLLNF